ncbi:hypothetical protein Ancab_036775 [Ancistrocladus abbreviatus]
MHRMCGLARGSAVSPNFLPKPYNFCKQLPDIVRDGSSSSAGMCFFLGNGYWLAYVKQYALSMMPIWLTRLLDVLILREQYRGKIAAGGNLHQMPKFPSVLATLNEAKAKM